MVRDEVTVQNSHNENVHKIVSIVDPKVLCIPIEESSEELVELNEQSLISFGPSPEVPNNLDYTKLRNSVYQKLVAAQKNLPEGLRLCLYEGYRSLDLQNKLFEDKYQLLKQEHSDWDHEQLFHQAVKLVSPTINLDGSHNIPPHCTGAAVDVYLIDDDGKAVDMGIHPADWMQDMDGSISQTNSSKISDIARQNREIMSSALTKAGFVNYPTEYWHWSYGDRYWAYNVRAEKALYGII